MSPIASSVSTVLHSIKELNSSDWIALAAATVAVASLLVSWRTAVYQRRTDHDRELLKQMILTLERAYASISEKDPLGLPKQSRLSWLTAARHIATFKSLKTELKTQLHIKLSEEHEEYWRHQFYVLLSRIGSSSFFEWNSPETGQPENIESTSAALIFAFSNWPKDRKDPLDDFSLKQLIQENDLFSLRFRHFRAYIETRLPNWSENDRNKSGQTSSGFIKADAVISTLSFVGRWLRRASPSRDIVLTILGAMAGWGVSHLYYTRSLDDTKAAANERLRVDELVFRGIEDVGDLKYYRDATGKVVGVAIKLRGQASGKVTATGNLRDTLEEK